MIDISIYSEKLDIALKQKSNSSYSKKIASELAKPEWQQRLFDLERIFSNVKDEQDFLKYQNTLTKLFDDIYEVITAPGVDDFISWINEITTDKNNTNAKKLRDFLVERYSESSVSESIVIINASKQVLDIENSIFNSLLNEVSKEIRKETINLLSDSKQFENKIDEYFENITTTFKGISAIKEVTFTNLEQLYSDKQNANKIGFYENYVKVIIEKGQTLKPRNEAEKVQDIITRVNSRISEIKKCIVLLDNSGTSKSDDELLKNIFLRLDKEIKYEKGLTDAVNDFIDNTWAVVESNYILIKNFYNSKILISYEKSWDIFPKKGFIISIIDTFNQLIKLNVLSNLLIKSNDEIIKHLNIQAKAIEKYNKQALELKSELVNEFNTMVQEFSASSKSQFLDNLSAKDEKLTKIKKDIESNIEGLRGGIKKLNEKENIILFLNEDFTYVLNNFNDIRSGFETFLQTSGMIPHLNWIDSKMNGTEIGTIGSQDLNNAILIKELLDRGLIKVEFKKTY